MNQAPFTSKRWRRVEYERLVDIGVFEHEPLGSSTSLIASSRSTGIPARI
jgi:hypothetical protein